MGFYLTTNCKDWLIISNYISFFHISFKIEMFITGFDSQTPWVEWCGELMNSLVQTFVWPKYKPNIQRLYTIKMNVKYDAWCGYWNSGLFVVNDGCPQILNIFNKSSGNQCRIHVYSKQFGIRKLMAHANISHLKHLPRIYKFECNRIICRLPTFILKERIAMDYEQKLLKWIRDAQQTKEE